MALFVVGSSKCAICRLVVSTSAEAMLFPAFLEPGHRLHRYSDAVFHRECFEAWIDRVEFVRLLSKFQAIMSARPRGVSLDEAERWAADAFRAMHDPTEDG